MFEHNAFFKSLKSKFEKSLEAYRSEVAQYRTGKASPKLLDTITIDYYGANTPLNQMASITVPDARLLMVQPFDRTCLKSIEDAIRNANIGFNPINDGITIKVPIPVLTEERRRDLVKQLSHLTEKYKVSLRNIRRDALDEVKNAQKEKEITEDDEKKFSDKVQDKLNEMVKNLEEVSKIKEKDILEL